MSHIKQILLCFVLLIPLSMWGDTNVWIKDVGLHGFHNGMAPVTVWVKNPFAEPETLQVRVTAGFDVANDIATLGVELKPNEGREVLAIVLLPGGYEKVTAVASARGVVIGRDEQTTKPAAGNQLVVMLCPDEKKCESVQSQIQFSGTVEERADKNRGLRFEAMHEVRDVWWAYKPASMIVVAMPTAPLSRDQRDALEQFVRDGGRMVLLDKEVADPSFLAAYRKSAENQAGAQISKGTLYSVPSLATNALGAVFTGKPLNALLHREAPFYPWSRPNWLLARYGAKFDFPRLRWVLAWLGVYIVLIGAVNFAVLRKLRRLEFGWLTMAALALAFAIGVYLAEVRHQPKAFRLDNMAVYSMDSRSGLASASYSLRVSSPERRSVSLRVADPALFVRDGNYYSPGEANSNIWSEITSKRASQWRTFEYSMDEPRRTELAMLKWSFDDLNMEGTRNFPGTVVMTAPGRLRNETGQQFEEAIFVDYERGLLYVLPALAPGQEIALEGIPPVDMRQSRPPNSYVPLEQRKTLSEMVQFLGGPTTGQAFAGISRETPLPAELNVPHETVVRSMVVVALEKP